MSSGGSSRKKRTPKKKATPKKVDEDEDIKSLTASMTGMKVAVRGSTPMFKMDFTLPYMIHVYKENHDTIVTVDLLVPTYPKDYFIPDVIDNGSTLQLRTRIPEFFPNEGRVLAAHGGDGFNQNTSQAQAFKDCCEEIDQHFGFVDTIYGDNPQVIPLPFKVEERILNWEVQGYQNNLGNLTDDLGGQQYHFTLSIDLMKLKTKRRTEGGFRIVGSAMEDDNL
jgi:hypothetical protein